MSEHHSIVIVGSGFSGLGMGIQLKRDGVEDFVILEKSSDLGGTWRDNSYPGCVCDVPSVMYSWSFAPNPKWTKMFAPASEIWEYERTVAERFGLPAHIRYEHGVERAAWVDEEQHWAIETTQGKLTADYLIAATGPLHAPAIPDLPGLESFAGKTMHSAEWDHEYSLDGRRVAVIGTGASAVQIIPEVQPKVARLSVFQRTPAWVLPRPNPTIPKRVRTMFRFLPFTEKLARAGVYALAETFGLAFRHPRLMALPERRALAALRIQVRDPELREKLTPTFRMGCKRVLNSDIYYPALAKPNVDVVTSAIKEVVPEGIIDGDGILHELDAIVFATGFHVTDPPTASRVHGRDGRTLAEHWAGSMEAYFGTAISGFPNLFFFAGPGTGLGHNSIIYMLESQARYVSRTLTFMRERGFATVEPRREAQQRWVDRNDRELEGTVWLTGGCSSWYRDEKGRVSTLWPRSTFAFRQAVQHFAASEHLLELAHPVRKPEPAAA